MPSIDFTSGLLSSVGKFAQGAYDTTIKPMADMADSYASTTFAPSKEAGGNWVNDMAMGLLQAHKAQFSKAAESYDQGHYSEAAGHALAGAVPFVGPAAAQAGEDIGSGQYAKGLGEATGLIGGALVGGRSGKAAKGVEAGEAVSRVVNGPKARMYEVPTRVTPADVAAAREGTLNRLAPPPPAEMKAFFDKLHADTLAGKRDTPYIGDGSEYRVPDAISATHKDHAIKWQGSEKEVPDFIKDKDVPLEGPLMGDKPKPGPGAANTDDPSFGYQIKKPYHYEPKSFDPETGDAAPTGQVFKHDFQLTGTVERRAQAIINSLDEKPGVQMLAKNILKPQGNMELDWLTVQKRLDRGGADLAQQMGTDTYNKLYDTAERGVARQAEVHASKAHVRGDVNEVQASESAFNPHNEQSARWGWGKLNQQREQIGSLDDPNVQVMGMNDPSRAPLTTADYEASNRAAKAFLHKQGALEGGDAASVIDEPIAKPLTAPRFDQLAKQTLARAENAFGKPLDSKWVNKTESAKRVDVDALATSAARDFLKQNGPTTGRVVSEGEVAGLADNLRDELANKFLTTAQHFGKMEGYNTPTQLKLPEDVLPAEVPLQEQAKLVGNTFKAQQEKAKVEKYALDNGTKRMKLDRALDIDAMLGKKGDPLRIPDEMTTSHAGHDIKWQGSSEQVPDFIKGKDTTPPAEGPLFGSDTLKIAAPLGAGTALTLASTKAEAKDKGFPGKTDIKPYDPEKMKFDIVTADDKGTPRYLPPEQDKMVKNLINSMAPEQVPTGGLIFVPENKYKDIQKQINHGTLFGKKITTQNEENFAPGADSLGDGFSLPAYRRTYLNAALLSNPKKLEYVLAHELGHNAAWLSKQNKPDFSETGADEFKDAYLKRGQMTRKNWDAIQHLHGALMGE